MSTTCNWNVGDKVIVVVPQAHIDREFVGRRSSGAFVSYRGFEFTGLECTISGDLQGTLISVTIDKRPGERIAIDATWLKPAWAKEPEAPKEPKMNLADSHYRTLETKGQEPIIRMEAIICRGIPEELHEVARRNLNMALASKHEDRAGEKSGEDWRKELTKAENYMHRAVHGCWIGKEASDKDSLVVGEEKSAFQREFDRNLARLTYPLAYMEPEIPAPVETWVEDESHWTDPATGTRYEASKDGCCGSCPMGGVNSEGTKLCKESKDRGRPTCLGWDRKDGKTVNQWNAVPK